MQHLRRILVSALCCLCFSIGCALPVSAADSFSDSEGILTVQRQLFGASNSGIVATYFFDNVTEQFTMNNGSYTLESDVKTINDPFLTTGYYIDFTFSIASQGTLTFTHEDYGSYVSAVLFNNTTYNILHDFDETDEILVTVFVDDVQKQLLTTTEKFVEESYPISHHLRVRLSSNFVNQEEFIFYDTSGNERGRISIDLWLDALFVPEGSEVPTDPTDPSDPSEPSGGGSGSQDLSQVIESIEIVQGHLEEINGNIVDIKDSVEDIKVQIEDTKQQLEDPSSPIWSAAGSAISDAIESLFVPDQEQISEVKQGFDDLAQDKLGGAYTAMETVDGLFSDVSGKLNNPSAAQGIEFPGIAFPMNGELIVIAEEQMVTLPTSLTAILHPVAGSIITICVGLGTFNVLKDMVECFLSGYSYAAYIHRKGGRSDE